MERQTILEVCLDSVESCVAAERGGADRVELCANLAEDGTTPTAGIIAAARSSVGIGIHVMIRPRGGDFCYTDFEYEAMKRDVAFVKQLGADGVVFGILTRDGQIEVDRVRELAGLARPMSVTFHRAFDIVVDPFESLEQLIESGVERLLTSGQAPSAAKGLGLLQRLVKQAGGRMRIMPGGGITAGNIRELRDGTGAREIHVGTGVSDRVNMRAPGGLFPAVSSRTVNADKVARVVHLLRES